MYIIERYWSEPYVASGYDIIGFANTEEEALDVLIRIEDAYCKKYNCTKEHTREFWSTNSLGSSFTPMNDSCYFYKEIKVTEIPDRDLEMLL